MKKLLLKFDKPETIYAKKTRIAKGNKTVDFLLAYDPALVDARPDIRLRVGSELLSPTLRRRAPRFFGSIQHAAAKVENASPKDCQLVRFAYEFETLDEGSDIELILQYGEEIDRTSITLINYSHKIQELRERTLKLALPTNKGTKRQYRAIVNTLSKLPMDLLRTVEAAETMALALGANHARPSRTYLYLTNIRKHYESAGEPEKYEAFETIFNSVIYPKTLYPHGYSEANKLHDVDPHDVKAMIEDSFEFLKSLGYDCFVNSGTLLGFVRDGRFIEHDDDVDIGVILHGRTVEEVVHEWINLHDILAEKGTGDVDKIRAYRIFKLSNNLGLNFDLFPAWFDENGAFSVYPHSYKNLTREDIYPLKKDPTFGMFMPANPEKMLESNYGPNWGAPDPLFRFNWGRAAQQFRPYLKEIDRQVERIAMTFGDFETLGAEEIQFLNNASRVGSRLLVACKNGGARSENFEARKAALLSIEYVDYVIPFENWDDISDDLTTYNAKVLAMPADRRGAFDELEADCEVVYLPNDQDVTNAGEALGEA